MRFHQHGQVERFGELTEIPKFLYGQDRGNQQDGVGSGGGGFQNVVLGERKILAQHRQAAGRARGDQVVRVPLEEIAIREYRETRRSALFILSGELGWLKVVNQDTLAGGGLLNFGNYGRPAGAERGTEIAAMGSGKSFGAGAEFHRRNGSFTKLFAFSCNDFSEDIRGLGQHIFIVAGPLWPPK